VGVAVNNAAVPVNMVGVTEGVGVCGVGVSEVLVNVIVGVTVGVSEVLVNVTVGVPKLAV
jgi:hypothetical protein